MTDQDLGPVDRGYWTNNDRENAEDAATAFVNALRRLQADFDDIGIEEPCVACNHPLHKVSLGSISVVEAEQFASRINRRLDELDALTEGAAPPTAPGRGPKRRPHMSVGAMNPPRRSIGATALVRNGGGAVLLVKTADRDEWQLPGCGAHQGERVATAASRELAEETGLHRRLTHFLALDHVPASTSAEGKSSAEGFTIVCDGGRLTPEEESALAVPEDAADGIAALKCVPLARLGDYTSPPQERRIRAAMSALDKGLRLPLLVLGT
ncbi:NUDIX domain-containing protein [Streptomyces sp. NBC_01500]|uniref:NUDIX domain-containing protein n=1 Tax=Streptomyces sp. NBC_01500 TaxID=2903886 RepID=UPI00224D6A43|nr:NUDIX domain-containing protein [Streptomyces sp. NBC_01500]MCX4549914.1 NUDIX domain-containing protein [Streptomyces sp. NBC_01500]